MIKALTLAATLALSTLGATSGSAATFFNIDDGGFAQQTTNGAFSYDFTFSLPTAGTLDASLTSSNAKIHFTSITLNGTALGKDSGPNNYSLTALAALAGTQTFHIAGTSAGASRFTTDLSFIAAVPEPAAWALMVVGFGALGATMRRRPAAGLVARV